MSEIHQALRDSWSTEDGGVSLRSARRQWAEETPGGRACGISESQQEWNEGDELRRAKEFQDRCEQVYGFRPSIMQARYSVRGRTLSGYFADLNCPDIPEVCSLDGTTQEVAAQLRRLHPEWNIQVGPERREPAQPWGGVAFSPGSAPTPVGNPAMAAQVLERQGRLLRSVAGG